MKVIFLRNFKPYLLKSFTFQRFLVGKKCFSKIFERKNSKFNSTESQNLPSKIGEKERNIRNVLKIRTIIYSKFLLFL